MCDCPRDEEDDARKIPETVTLFRKCTKPDRPMKDIGKSASCDTILDKNVWSPADSSQSNLRYTICGSPKGSQFNSSSFSSSTETVILFTFISKQY